MNIVHVEDHFLPTGGYQINFLTKWHVQHGHEATVVSSRSLEPWAQSGFVDVNTLLNIADHDRRFCQATGVGLIRLPTLGSYSHRQFFCPSLFRAVQTLKPDVVFVHGNDTLTGMRFITRSGRLPYPIVLDNHMVEVASQNPFNRLFRQFYRAFITPKIERQRLTVIALAKDVQDYCARHYAIPREQMPIVSWGVDTALFCPDGAKRRNFRREHGIGENDFVLIYTGKITLEKKLHLLAQAVEGEFPGPRKVVFVMVGSGAGDYFGKVKSVLDRSANRVILFPTQPVAALAPFYQAANLAVWPGACSLSFFDAQACGLPVVAEAIAANRERISSERGNGWLYEPENGSALRQVIEQCLRMEAAAFAEAGQNALEYVSANFDYNKITSQVEVLMARDRGSWEAQRTRG